MGGWEFDKFYSQPIIFRIIIALISINQQWREKKLHVLPLLENQKKLPVRKALNKSDVQLIQPDLQIFPTQLRLWWNGPGEGHVVPVQIPGLQGSKKDRQGIDQSVFWRLSFFTMSDIKKKKTHLEKHIVQTIC